MAETIETKQIEAFWFGLSGIESLLKNKSVVLLASGKENQELSRFLQDKFEGEKFDYTTRFLYGDDEKLYGGDEAYSSALKSADLIIVIPGKIEMEGTVVTRAFNFTSQPIAWEYPSDGLPGTKGIPSRFGREKMIVIGKPQEINPKYQAVNGGVINILDLNSGETFLEGVERILKK